MATAVTLMGATETCTTATATRNNASTSQSIPAHPPPAKKNALENWAQMEGLMANKQVVLFLDYDGTLSPIVDEPEKAFMKDGMKRVLAEATSCFTTAIVTGRSKDKVFNFVGLDNIVYAGSHGLEIQAPLKQTFTCQMVENVQGKLQNSIAKLHAILRHITGFEIEDNKFSLSVHYRHVPISSVDEVHRLVYQYAAEDQAMMVKAGKKVLELRPKVDWNKGSAVNWILDELDLGKRQDVFAIYLGDDITDEDAFVAMEKRGAGGVGVLVKEAFDPERPPETQASFSLKNPDEVEIFLRNLVSYAKSNNVTKSG